MDFLFIYLFILIKQLTLFPKKLITKQKFEKGYLAVQKAYNFTSNIESMTVIYSIPVMDTKSADARTSWGPICDDLFLFHPFCSSSCEFISHT